MTENGSTTVEQAVKELLDSETHVKALRESWGFIEVDKKKYAVELFIRLFKSAPAAKERFEQFKNVPTDELRDHRKMKGHATTFMYGLKSFMENLDDPELFEEMIRKTARNHIKRGISAAEFNLLGPPVLTLLEEIMGDSYTEATKESWVQLLGVIICIVNDELIQQG